MREMEIAKAALVKSLEADTGQMDLINFHTLEPLTADEVFVFKIAACDNEVDRDTEVFPAETLRQLAGLYVGRTVIFDHQRKAENQCARIYAAQVEAAEGKTSSTGEGYAELVLYCYMLKTESNRDLIADIRGGIKKEVSVGCRVGRAVCSVCGADRYQTWCEHMPGEVYGGKACHIRLEDAAEAYEVSFVAVPAQPQAGTKKSYAGEVCPGGNATQRLRMAEAFIFTKQEDGNE